MHALLALTLLAQIQVRESPKDWRLITTEHFNVYYPADELLPRARQFAAWFEESRATLAARTGVELPRVNVFMYRSFHDLLQSSFLGQFQSSSLRARRGLLGSEPRPPFCRPNAHSRALALSEPLRNRIFIHCQASDRWNAWFIRHELAHQFQFQNSFSYRLPSWLIVLRGTITPEWFWEGGADYLADIFDSDKDEYMRDLASERLYTLKELFSFDTLNAYDSQAPYYEGSYFWRFLDQKYGQGPSRKLFDNYGEGVPFPEQIPLRDATGHKRAALEREFAKHLQDGWAPMMEGRGAPTDRLTDTRSYYRRRAWGGRWSPDGAHLAWVGNVDTWPELYVDGRGLLGWRRGIDVNFVVSAPSWSPDGKRLAVIEWTTNRDVLLLVDTDGHYERVELPYDELSDPAWAPDGDRVAFAALKDGTSDIYVLRLSDRSVERVTNDGDGDSAPAWSRDGKLAWIKETDGHTVLYILGQGAVTKSWALLEYPQWSPDGKSIAVAADVGGVYDAFAVDPTTGRAKRLTRFRGGVSYPSYHPDGSLVVTYFQGRGQDLYRVRAEPQDELAFDQEDRRGWYDQFKKPAQQGEPAEKSRVLGVDWLMFPVTSVVPILPGFQTMIGDRDAENSFFTNGYALPGSWSVESRYTNTRWRPTFGASASLSHSRDLWEERTEPFVDYPLSPKLQVGAGWVGRRRLDREIDASFLDSGPTVSIFFSDLVDYQNQVFSLASAGDPAWGFSFGAFATFFDESLGGDRNLREYFGFFEAARDVVQDWIVWTRLTFEKEQGRVFLADEVLHLSDAVRGAKGLAGFERGVASLELRYPIWRDLLWQPLELFGLGEEWVIKDLRGFVFGQAGYAGFTFEDAFDRSFGAASAGAGLRLDFSLMLWPVMNLRIPMRLEFWWALVGQDDRGPRGTTGFGLQIGF